MENMDLWESNRSIQDNIDIMYEDSDKIVFEILRRIASLAINEMSSNGRMEASEASHCGSNPHNSAK